MRSLLLLRHGKSDWGPSGAEDQSRPLARRGRKGAAAIGRFLATNGPLPDRALTSPALRALETLRIAMADGGWTCPVETRPALYEGVPQVLDDLSQGSFDEPVLLAVGHEPTSSELIRVLTGGRVRMPTAALALIDLDIESWSDLAAGVGELVWLVTPRLLQTGGATKPN